MRKLYGIITLLVLMSPSCSKDNDAPPQDHSVTGVWIGTYTIDQFPQQQPLPYNFFIKPDGKVVSEGKASNGSTYYHQGSWSVANDTLSLSYATINFPSVTVYQSAKFHFNSATGVLSGGTWKDGQNGSNYTGKFQNMAKVQ